MSRSSPGTVTVLGGGIAGLAVAVEARRVGRDVRILEAEVAPGGLCRTISLQDARFDTGAHRFHDRDPEATRLVRDLLGDDLREIDAPTRIHRDGRFVDFPLSPYNILANLGPRTTLRAGWEVLVNRLRRLPAPNNFEEFAVQAYGRTLADSFLLDYTRKLWGIPCRELSTSIAGTRLQGLDLAGFFREAFRGRGRHARHLDGNFLYPRRGIGQIAEKMADRIGREKIAMSSRVTGIYHDGRRIESVEVNGGERVAVDEVVSSIPLPDFVRAFSPSLPASVLALADRLSFRPIILVAVHLKQHRVTPAAAIHFPEADIPFTRLYEPTNRSRELAPEGETILVAELPSSGEDALWHRDEEELIDGTLRHHERLGFYRRTDVIGIKVIRLPHAYPVLSLDATAAAAELLRYLERFTNLTMLGRNSRFEYLHIHHLLAAARRQAASWKASE